MRKNNYTIYIVCFAMFAAMVAYLVVSWYRSVSDPFRTEQAVEYTLQSSVSVSGLVVRDEKLLTSSAGIIDVDAEEGEHIAIGVPVAHAYSSEEQRSHSVELHSVETKLEQLEQAVSGSGSSAVTEAEVYDAIYELYSAAAVGSFDDCKEQTDEVKSLLFGRKYADDSTAALSELNELRSERDRLSSSYSSGTAIYSSETGVFSAFTDGLEAVITPALIDDLDLNTLYSLMEREGKVSSDVYGKLITGLGWYYAAAVSEEDFDTLSLKVNGSVVLSFGRGQLKNVKMTVHYIGDVENGERLVVFYSNRNLSDIAGLRCSDAEIAVDTYSGVRVSVEALHLDSSGKPCVYIVYGLQAHRIGVTIVYEGDGYCIVQPTDGSTRLSSGSEVIVSADGLTDGMVISGSGW